MKGFFATVLMTLLSQGLVAQLENSIWYFGQNCGLQFEDGPPLVLLDNAAPSIVACGSICNATGDLILYASPQTIRNGQHQAVQNGSGFLFTAASPSPLVVPWPGQSQRFLVFGWRTDFFTQALEQYYQVVDISAGGGTGAVLVKDSLLCDSVGNGIVAVPHCNGQDHWIVVHERNSDHFLSYHLDGNGSLTNPIQSVVGPVHSYWSLEPDCLQASPDGTRLAYAYDAGVSWNLDLYDIDPCSGIVSNGLTIAHGDHLQIPEFSPNGQLLYVGDNACLPSDSSRYFQFDISSGDSLQIVASRTLLHAQAWSANCDLTLFQSAAAPNGKVYVAIRDTTCLGVVNSPNTPGQGCDFVYCGQDLGGRRNNVSLPHQVKFPPSPNAISERPDDPEPLRIHPTPASDGIWLDTDLATHLELLDLQGRMVQSARVNGTGPHWLQREGLGAGTYVLRAFSERGEVIGYGRVVFR